jgi:hypothetical protein
MPETSKGPTSAAPISQIVRKCKPDASIAAGKLGGNAAGLLRKLGKTW